MNSRSHNSMKYNIFRPTFLVSSCILMHFGCYRDHPPSAPQISANQEQQTIKTAPSVEASIPSISHHHLKIHLKAPQGVDRWEPSGVIAALKDGEEALWVVSDKNGWLARYSLPLSLGDQQPEVAFQLQLSPLQKVKWEGLAWEKSEAGTGSLLLLEAFSRSVWRCSDPDQGCKDIVRVGTHDYNPALNKTVPSPFRYIMFEALAYLEEPIIGIRGYHDRAEGLTPWSMLFEINSHKVRRDHRDGLTYQSRRYGISGAQYDAQRRGLWITWSYEREEGATVDAVSGLLTFTSLDPLADQAHKISELSAEHAQSSRPLLCAYYKLKPEGVTLSSQDELILIFDNDMDRKGGRQSSEAQFPLDPSEDYAHVVKAREVHSKCVLLPDE